MTTRNQNTETLTNKTISNLVSTGTSDSMLSGKFTKSYITGISTVGNTTSTFITIAVPTNSAIIVKAWVMAFCTASSGADLNKLRAFDATFAAKNISGTVTTYSILNNNASDAAYAPTLAVSASGTNLLIQVTGVNNDTISWSGNVIINYQ